MAKAQTFRANVGVVVADHAGRVLALSRAGRPGAWQLPQGGLDMGEEPEAAAWRELEEETGLDAEQVELVAEHPRWLTYELPPELEPYVAEKGSIAIDGVSLTVNGVSPGKFWVMLVPFTRQETHLDGKQPGDVVNLETDVLAKYIARLLSFGRGADVASQKEETGSGGGDTGNLKGGVTLDLLLKQGFAG